MKMNTLALVHRINEALQVQGLSPKHLQGRLESFHQNVLQIYHNIQKIEGPMGTVILEYGLLEPAAPQKIEKKYLPPLPREIFPLLSEFEKVSSVEAKKALHANVFIMLPQGPRQIYCVSTPADFSDPTYPPSNTRARIVLNTIDYNRMMIDRAIPPSRYEKDFEIRERYPRIDLQKIPRNVIVDSNDVYQGLIDLQRLGKGEVFDFKGYQSCLFVYPIACYYIHVLEGRWCDQDELLELTQSRITLAELREHYEDFHGEKKLSRGKEYLQKRKTVERMVSRHLQKLVQLGFLATKKYGKQRFFRVVGKSFSDRSRQTLWLPPEILIKKVHADNLRVWKPIKRSLTNIPGQLEERVFIGGSTPYLPTLRVIEAIVAHEGKQPVLAYDFEIPKNDTYYGCIHLLFGCKQAIFDISEHAGQLFEVQKALEFGLPTLLLFREIIPGFSMLETLAKRHGVKTESYSNFEEMKEKIIKFLGQNVA